MNGKDLLLGMNNIDDSYIDEADKKVLKKYHTSSRKHWIAIAACFGLIITAVFTVIPEVFQKPKIIPSKSKVESGNNLESDFAGKPNDTAEVDGIAKPEGDLMSDKDIVVVNEMSEFPNVSEKRVDFSSKYKRQNWTKKETYDYFGKDLTPSYVPTGLHAARNNGKANIIVKKDNTNVIVNDEISYSYYHEYNKDGLPKWTDGVNAAKGFAVTISKVGIDRDCLYIMPGKDEIKISTIKDVPVTIGHRLMAYGPYEPKTHKPSGHYDLYVAEFKYDGMEYEVITEQLPLEEVVKIVRGLIL